MKKRRPGQPTKYRKEYCTTVRELGKKGDTIEMIAETLDVHRDTLYEWAKVHKEFSDALKRVRQSHYVAMQKIGRAGITGQIKNFSQAAWIFWMKAQFGWRDEPELETEESDLEFIS